MDRGEKYPLVSIIMPSYNTAGFIAESIESILAQSYKNWELLIVDDCSSDNSISVIEPFTRLYDNIHLTRFEENVGPATARNTAINAAKGRFIAFLDSDDIWLPDKLLSQIEFMRSEDITLSYTAYQKIAEDGSFIGSSIQVPPSVTYEELLLSCVIGCLTAIYDTQKIGKVYMPNLPKGQDYGLWLKILKSGTMAYGLNQTLAHYRIRRNSISRNKLKKARYQWRIYRQVEKLSLWSSIYYMLNYAYFGYIRMRT